MISCICGGSAELLGLVIASGILTYSITSAKKCYICAERSLKWMKTRKKP